jgi:hypothetical protein
MLGELGDQLRVENIVPQRIAVFPGDQASIDAARHHFPDCPIGSGTPYFFVQLNRMEDLGEADFLTFTTSSIVHGAEDDAVMLGLQSLPSMVETLRVRYPGIAICVGPSGIAAPASPLGLSAESDGAARVALARIDPRSTALFGAAWLLGYIAQLACSHVQSVTISRLTGVSGILGMDSYGAMIRHPPFHVLQRLMRASIAFATSISDASRVAALLVESSQGRELILANLTGDDLDLALTGWASTSDVTVLDERSCGLFATTPDPWRRLARRTHAKNIRLLPYAIASLVSVT